MAERPSRKRDVSGGGKRPASRTNRKRRVSGDSDAEYKRRIREIDAEYKRKIREIEERSRRERARIDAYFARRAKKHKRELQAALARIEKAQKAALEKDLKRIRREERQERVKTHQEKAVEKAAPKTPRETRLVEQRAAQWSRFSGGGKSKRIDERLEKVEKILQEKHPELSEKDARDWAYRVLYKLDVERNGKLTARNVERVYQAYPKINKSKIS